MRNLFIVFIMILTGCSSTRYYIVRHAEKMVMQKDSLAMMANNPPLSEAGKVRAFVLRDELKNKNIRHIYTTRTIRTVSTAQPLSESLGNLPIEHYSTSKDSLDFFIEKLKSTKGNSLIVGHSNTVDDIANKLTGKTVVAADLADQTYDQLYIVTRKGKKWVFARKNYGYPSNPE